MVAVNENLAFEFEVLHILQCLLLLVMLLRFQIYYREIFRA
jgi:hypothetical protein